MTLTTSHHCIDFDFIRLHWNFISVYLNSPSASIVYSLGKTSLINFSALFVEILGTKPIFGINQAEYTTWEQKRTKHARCVIFYFIKFSNSTKRTYGMNLQFFKKNASFIAVLAIAEVAYSLSYSLACSSLPSVTHFLDPMRTPNDKYCHQNYYYSFKT